MPKTMLPRQLGRLFILSWSTAVQYRGDLIIWLTAITATPLLSLAIWHSIAASGDSALASQDILTYFILVMFVRVTTAFWRGYYLIQKILSGEIVNYLIRPRIILAEYITTPLVHRGLQLLIPLSLFIAALAIWPHVFTPTIYNPTNLGLFALSLLAAAAISFCFDLSMGLCAFWLEDAQELMAYRFLLTQVASGVIIPFAVMPDWLFTTFSLLPFRYIVSAPVEILMGQVVGSGAWQLIGIQVIWAMAFVGIMRVLYVRGLKRYAIPGQ